MAFVPAPGIIRLVASYAIFAETTSNTVYVQDEDSPGAVRVGQAATAFSLALQNHVLPELSNQCSLVRVQAYDMSSEIAPVATIVIDPGVPGGLAGPTLPTVVAARIKLLTGFRGRSYRGRIFQAGLGEATVGGTSLTDADAALLQAAYANVQDDLDAEFFTLGVLSTVSGGAPRTTGLFTEVTAIEVPRDVSGLSRRKGE